MPGAVLAVAVVLLFVNRTKNGDDEKPDGVSTGNHIQIPHVDGLAIELDSERGNETQDFLNSFVSNYQPVAEVEAEVEADAIAKAVDIEGYCHPRLLAAPQHRTQRVSHSKNVASDSSVGVWWQKFLQLIYDNTESAGDSGIQTGELVMKLPRPLQIWDLDALRDKFIQQEFLGLAASRTGDDDALDRSSSKVAARHKDTHNPLDSGAFLAVYLLRLLHGSRAEKTSSGDGNNGQCNNASEGCNLLQQWGDLEQHKERTDLLSPYLNILPTVDDREAKKSPSSKPSPHSHPLFWSSSLLESLFPRHTHTFDMIRHYQQMVESEYDALKLMSREFGKSVSYLDYLNTRINVLSRAFGVSAAAGDNGVLWGSADGEKGSPLMEEMRSYETSNFGSYLDDAHESDDDGVEEFKLRSMCPLLDMYNSHPNPNVSWRHDSKTSSYLIHAKSIIPPGDSIVVSYGKYTESHLFAKYGYVNGDGSSPTEVSLAVFHRMLGDIGLGRQYSPLPFQVWDPDFRDEFFSNMLDGGSNVDYKVRKSLQSARQALKIQSKELLRYIMFDDGYDECIQSTTSSKSEDDELKLLKLRHLIHVANYRDVWVVRVQPRFPDAQPSQGLLVSGKDGDEKKESVGVNAKRILSLCRLLSLRGDDMGGEAIDYLREGLASLTATSDPFFFVEKQDDALEYRAMMCVSRLAIAALGRYMGKDNNEPELVGSREWNAWYIKSGEVRSLGILQQTASSEGQKLKQKYQSSEGANDATDSAWIVRDQSCSLNYTLPLLHRL